MNAAELIALLGTIPPETEILVGYESIAKPVLADDTEVWEGSGAVLDPFVITADERMYWDEAVEMLPGPPPPTEEELRATLLDDIEEWNGLLRRARDAGPIPEAPTPPRIVMNPYPNFGNPGSVTDETPELGLMGEMVMDFITMSDGHYFYSTPVWARALNNADKSRAMSLAAPLADRCRQLGVEMPPMSPDELIGT